MVVTIVGIPDPIDQTVGAGGGAVELPIAECIGTSIEVKTAVGELIGTVDEPACPGWLLTINQDRSLTYDEGFD